MRGTYAALVLLAFLGLGSSGNHYGHDQGNGNHYGHDQGNGNHNGHPDLSGYDVLISVDGEIQVFTSFQLQTSGAGSATQDEDGSVSLTVDSSVSSLAAVRAMIPESFPAGTEIQFEILQAFALEAEGVTAHCRLDRLPSVATIPNSFFTVDSASVGLHVVTLAAAEPDGIVLHCELNMSFDIPGL